MPRAPIAQIALTQTGGTHEVPPVSLCLESRDGGTELRRARMTQPAPDRALPLRRARGWPMARSEVL